MRCYWKRSLMTLGSLSLFFLLLLFVSLGLRTEEDSFATEESRRWAREVAMRQIYSERNGENFRELWNSSLPINISYSHLAGFPNHKKKYLTVGLSSVKRKRGNYLLETLKSIFEQSSNEELKEMVVVVHLADFDQAWNSKVVKDISRKFSHHVLSGHLIVIHAPQEHYPPLQGLKRNFNDAPDRVQFRSKQNVDYAFLLNFCANLSRYYLMLEDDIHCSKSFFTAIKKVLTSREGSYWVTLEFSKLGYIGKLYQSSDLPRLAQFLLMFYQEMPCDWLLVHFRVLLTQKDVIRFKPSLFQHNGFYSSFLGTANRLKDDDFEEDSIDLPDNPPAAIYTNISTFENYNPSKAYSNVDEYFWGKSPLVGDYFTIVFVKPVVLTRLRIQSGTEERQSDMLHAGLVELGKDPARIKEKVECSSYVKLGRFENGQFESKDIDKKIHSAVSCIKIVVTESQKEWLIIRSTSIWTKQSKA
ncbi:alpha-1,3-mannosyl-glycoprotein 4-beta-N-acetylglucosaminyltransferase C-like [Huso huso]|uniref:Alpha-1,3-mannosyl-glycoprotein 4-beta-N-acetylglucosaminyltransferase C-like n=1 Tax=Huso huso TaxID=61971 RepID=A0ABR0YIH7_HUSHU